MVNEPWATYWPWLPSNFSIVMTRRPRATKPLALGRLGFCGGTRQCKDACSCRLPSDDRKEADIHGTATRSHRLLSSMSLLQSDLHSCQTNGTQSSCDFSMVRSTGAKLNFQPPAADGSD